MRRFLVTTALAAGLWFGLPHFTHCLLPGRVCYFVKYFEALGRVDPSTGAWQRLMYSLLLAGAEPHRAPAPAKCAIGSWPST
jgi:hypothetical protein